MPSKTKKTIAIVSSIAGVAILAVIGIVVFYVMQSDTATTATTIATTTTTQIPVADDTTDVTQTKNMSSKGNVYYWIPGKDAAWVGADNSIEISPYESDLATFDKCDALAGCSVGVRYGSNVYYRPGPVASPFDWLGDSPSPAEDGSWVRSK